MEIFERIEIRGIRLGQPPPVPADELIALLGQRGFSFQCEDGLVCLHDRYEPSRYDDIRRLLESKGIAARINRVFMQEFDDSDFERAPIWEVDGFAEPEVGNIELEVTCGCGRNYHPIDPTIRAKRVRSNRPIAMANGQFAIVRKDLAARITESLSGAYRSMTKVATSICCRPAHCGD